MIRTLSGNCASMLLCSKDDGKTVDETAFNEMVMREARALCQFSLLVSQQNHSDLSLEALDDALNQFYQKKGIFREQKMLKSMKAKVNDRLAMESHQLCVQNIHKISAAMEALVYGAKTVSTTQRRQCQVSLNRARQVSTTWSDADCPKAIERMEQEIHQVIPVKPKSLINYTNIISNNHCRKPELR